MASFGLAVEVLGLTLLHTLWQGALIALGLVAARALTPNQPLLRYWMGLLAALGFVLWAIVTAVQIAAAPRPEVAAHSPALALLVPLLPWMVMAWLAGVIHISVSLIADWRRLRDVIRNASQELPEPLAGSVGRLRRVFDLAAQEVLISTQVAVPMVVGWFRPKVLLPAAILTGLTPRQVELIVAHEFGHIRRWDPVVNLLQVLGDTVFFYHPGWRWMSSCLRQDRELCCDDLVVARMGDSVGYARALTEMESLRHEALAWQLTVTGGDLLARIRRLVAKPEQRGVAHWGLATMLLIVALVAAPGVHFMTREMTPVTDAAVPIAMMETPTGSAVAVPAAESPLARPRLELAEIALPSIARLTAPQRIVPDTPPVRSASPLALAPPKLVFEAPELDLALISVNRAKRTLASEIALPSAETPQVTGGELVRMVEPRFPRRALLGGIEGWVKVAFTVESDGSVSEPAVLEALPSKIFDRNTLRAVKKWEFEPFLVDGVPTEQRVTRTIDFKVAQEGQPRYASGCSTVTGSRLCTNRRLRLEDVDEGVIRQAASGPGSRTASNP